MSGSKLIYNKLLEKNVKDVFMYSGGAIMPLIDQFYKGKINYFIPTNELSLGLSAVGYAKSTGKPGVCVVTSGPGLTNMVTSITDSNNDSSPLIVLSGQVPLNAMGTLAFQECPATKITKSVTKWSYCVKDVSEIPDVMDYAFYISQYGKPGSVHIDLPKCVLTTQYSINTTTNQTIYYNNFNKMPHYNCNRNDEFIRKINDASNIINNSKKPILYVGKGAIDCQKQITELVKYCNIPITTTLHAMGIFDENEELSLKMVGMHGSMAANLSIQNSDLVIAIGSRFDDRTIGLPSEYAPNAKIIQINIDKNEENKIINADIYFKNDVSFVLKYLFPKLNKQISSIEWIEFIKNKKKNIFLIMKKPILLKLRMF